MVKMTGGPIQKGYVEQMNYLAHFIDTIFNGNAKGADRTVGFTLLVFPIDGTGEIGRCNYISNSNRDDIVTMMKEVIARFEGKPEQSGRA